MSVGARYEDIEQGWFADDGQFVDQTARFDLARNMAMESFQEMHESEIVYGAFLHGSAMVNYDMPNQPPAPGPRSDIDAYAALNRTDPNALLTIRNTVAELYAETHVPLEFRPDSVEQYASLEGLRYTKPMLLWARYQSQHRPEHVIGDNPLELAAGPSSDRLLMMRHDPYEDIDGLLDELQWEYGKLAVTPYERIIGPEEKLAHILDTPYRVARRFEDTYHLAYQVLAGQVEPGSQYIGKSQVRSGMFRHLAEHDVEIVLQHDALHNTAHDYDELVRRSSNSGLTRAAYDTWIKDVLTESLPVASDFVRRVRAIGSKVIHSKAMEYYS